MRMFMVGVGLCLSIASLGASSRESRNVETWTGWFSDKRCARAAAEGESVRPNGTTCVKRCLDEGSIPVFLSEQSNAIYEVRDHSSVRDDVGYRVEISAVVDEKSKSISVRSVKRLSEVTALCLLPKKRGA